MIKGGGWNAYKMKPETPNFRRSLVPAAGGRPILPLENVYKISLKSALT